MNTEIQNTTTPLSTEAQLDAWTKFYAELGIKLNLDVIVIPTRREGFDRLIVVAEGITPQRAFMACKDKFLAKPLHPNYNDRPDMGAYKNDRDPKNGTYAIWARDNREADEDLKDLSADDLKKQNIITMTFLERLLYELKFFQETGKHLDLKNVTLCAGSRAPSESVPEVDWSDDKLVVAWCYTGAAYLDLRARAVVS